MIDSQNKLVNYYRQHSKHSNYQVLPNSLKKILGAHNLNTKSRFERERLLFLTKNINFKQKRVLDIGGNTGFFSFELLEQGAEEVCYYEGNKSHSEFVRLASRVLKVENKLKVVGEYFNFSNTFSEHFDVTLLFNVLHHTGDDYGEWVPSINAVKTTITKELNPLAKNTKYLVFQMGYNWMGDTEKPIFMHGQKQEMINFIKGGVDNCWEIESIGIAQEENEKIVYKNLNQDNIRRVDRLGEFLNRPIFILKSLKYDE
ncbi:MAG: hypothetical protein H6793_01915 [Candidatus Nomurabacteria bacterium]|nr:MAG: hypothetical protein H6793_01915 [Candidatus Nomurabacteria bacterium]